MTRFNRLVLLVFAAVVLAETSSYAQEREPLAMRIELEWTVAWTVVGALAGAALWLTDPGNPNLSLARQSIGTIRDLARPTTARLRPRIRCRT